MAHVSLDEAICLLPYSGAANEKLAQWLLAHGASGGSLQELWIQFLASQGFPTGSWNERRRAFYLNRGFTGTLNESEYAFFHGGAVISLPDASYDHTIADSAHDGREVLDQDNFSTVLLANCWCIDYDGTATLTSGDFVTSLQFPGLTFNPGSTCSSATLYLHIKTPLVVGTIKVVGEKAVATVPVLFDGQVRPCTDILSTGNPPFNIATAASVSYATSVNEVKALNVKPIIDEMLAAANWEYGNYATLLILPASTFVYQSFGHVGSGTAARLVVNV